MSTAGQPTSFAELYGDLLSRMRADVTASGASELIAKRYLNIALADVHIQQNWPWAERTATVITRPPYSTGDVSITAASRSALVGGGTLWKTAIAGMDFNNLNVGAKIRLGGQEIYKVATVNNDVSASLLSRYVENITTASTYALAYGSYTAYQDEYTLASDFFRLVDVRQFSDVMNIPVLGSQDFYRRFPRNSTRSGSPERCTIIELGQDSSADWQPRVVFTPYPDTSYQIPYRYMTRNLAISSAGVPSTEMSADTDQPIIPVRYRHILLSYSSSLWYRDQKDDGRAQECYQEYVDGVKRIAGDSSPQRDRPRLIPMHMTRQPVFARGRGGRFTVNPDAWDSLRE